MFLFLKEEHHPLVRLGLEGGIPPAECGSLGPRIHFSQRNTWVVYGPRQDGSQQFTLGRPRILQDSTSRAIHLSQKPRGDFKNQKKTKQKPAYRKMTTVHGCVSNKHHHQRKWYLSLSFSGEQGRKQDIPSRVTPEPCCPQRKPHTVSHTRVPRTHTCYTRLSSIRFPFLYFWFAVSLEDSSVQEQKFESGLCGGRKQKKTPEGKLRCCSHNGFNNVLTICDICIPNQSNNQTSIYWTPFMCVRYLKIHMMEIDTHILKEIPASFAWEMNTFINKYPEKLGD